MKKVGIFGFFFSRAALAIISFVVILLFVLLPFFNKQLLRMVQNQGEMFANSTIAATTTALYKESYGEVVEYLGKVLKDTDNILFVIVTTPTGAEILIEKDQWHMYQDRYDFDEQAKDHELTISNQINSQSDAFIYHQDIDIGQVNWGKLSIGMSNQQYLFVKNRYSLIVIGVSVLLLVLLLLMFYRSAKNIRTEIASLSETGSQLQKGNLAARASEEGIGEIGTLSKAINTMALNLQEKTNSTRQLAQIVEQTNDAFILLDSSLHIVFVNDALEKISGYPASDFIGMSMVDFAGILNFGLDKTLYELNWVVSHDKESIVRDIEILRNDQSPIDIEMRIERIITQDNADHHLLIVFSNITTRKHLEHELHQLAFYDKLTSLPNRRMFMDQLRDTFHESKQNQNKFALFFMDLDNFKFVNDTLGHEAGDAFLVQVANKLKGLFRTDDIVTRLGGDEFTVLIKHIRDEEDATRLAEQLVVEMAAKPIQFNNRTLPVTISLGVACYPDSAQDVEGLLRNADIAMYQAKQSGKNRFALYDDAMNTDVNYRVEMERDLEQAIKQQDQITFYYQPIMDLATNTLIGAEALARWKHPQKGFIRPDEFIQVAENSNLINTLGDYLFEVFFKQAKLWGQRPTAPYLSLNISVRQFVRPKFVSQLQGLLNQYKVDASKIQLEFTESIMLDTTNETIDKFKELKAMGFKIAIDDFGTGYSSLGYIHQLPIDVIKIDKSFVFGMLENKTSHAIVSAVLKLSNTLGLKTIAEGVELASHEQKLKEYQCDYAQGYYYDAALPVIEFERKYFAKAELLELPKVS